MAARGLGSYYTGYKWCRPSTRWAIYWRDRNPRNDSLRCLWCGACATVQDVFKGLLRLSLDHLDPWSAGGSNEVTNLVTSCLSCNARRGKESFEETAITERYGVRVFTRINRVRLLPLDRPRGRELAKLCPSRMWRQPALVRAREIADSSCLFAPPLVDPSFIGA